MLHFPFSIFHFPFSILCRGAGLSSSEHLSRTETDFDRLINKKQANMNTDAGFFSSVR
jgi:hypothetical protein